MSFHLCFSMYINVCILFSLFVTFYLPFLLSYIKPLNMLFSSSSFIFLPVMSFILMINVCYAVANCSVCVWRVCVCVCARTSSMSVCSVFILPNRKHLNCKAIYSLWHSMTSSRVRLPRACCQTCLAGEETSTLSDSAHIKRNLSKLRKWFGWRCFSFFFTPWNMRGVWEGESACVCPQTRDTEFIHHLRTQHFTWHHTSFSPYATAAWQPARFTCTVQTCVHARTWCHMMPCASDCQFDESPVSGPLG